jgi:hypothetical protein
MFRMSSGVPRIHHREQVVSRLVTVPSVISDYCDIFHCRDEGPYHEASGRSPGPFQTKSSGETDGTRDECARC